MEIAVGNEKTIFISHRSADKDVADMVMTFLVQTGIPREYIFCSSLPGNDINEKISAEVKEDLKHSVINIAILSRDYYQSAYCLNEAGILWFCDVPVIPIALPEITPENMYGFLNNEYKIRRLDCSADIAYVYDTVCKAVGIQSSSFPIIVAESEKLIGRYNDFVMHRQEPAQTSETAPPFQMESITTDDERIVLHSILEKEIRKVNKKKLLDWIIENEIKNVDIDNGFDLLSEFDGGFTQDDTLEFSIKAFRELIKRKDVALPILKEHVDRHIVRSADVFSASWDSMEPDLMLFIAYIIDERVSSFGNRSMIEAQIESIKDWERKNSLDSTLSSNYMSCLNYIVTHDLVYESDWTGYGNPREYALYPSLKDMLFNHFEANIPQLEECKRKHEFVLPF